MILDNTSLAVKQVLSGRDRLETEAFAAFRGAYPFRAELSARSKRSVSVAWSRLARLMCANSSTSSSNITITRETIRARDNQLLQRPPPPVNPDADVEQRERLGGLLSFYYRETARGGG